MLCDPGSNVTDDESVDIDMNDDVEQNDDNNDNSSATTRQWFDMVPNACGGETVKVRVFCNYKSYSEANLIEIVEASQSRIGPYPLASECDDCQLQHTSIDSQRALKRDWVRESLLYYKLTDEASLVQPTMGTPEILEYRSKLTPDYQAPIKINTNMSNDSNQPSVQVIGFQRQTSRRIVDVPSCLIATPAVNKAYKDLRPNLPNTPRGGTLLLRQGQLSDAKEAIVTNHQVYLITTVWGLDFRYRAGNFF
jgi:tRNA/tmRNA/rRNA uracil-C5-methylase (TrmA/RlmC/RlmD family)